MLPADLPAFEHAVVGVHVLGGGGDGVVGLWVPEEEVGVFAFGYNAFACEAEDAGWVGADEGYELLRGEEAGVDAVVPEELEAVFDAGAAVGDFGEVVLSERLLLGGKRAVVGGDDLQAAVGEGGPEGGVIFALAEGWGEDVFGFVEGVAGHLVFEAQDEVLGAGFGQGS